MGQLQITRRRATRRRSETVQTEPPRHQPTRADGATDEACASVLARIDELTAEA